jgi:DNA polymerase III subunit epsilon
MNVMDIQLPDELLSLGDFAFIDVETTGANPLSDRLTEIAVIRFSRGSAPQRWQTLVNPGASIPAQIQSLTGITNDMVRDAPSFFDVREELRALLDDAYFVAHNARFDYGFIKNEYRRINESFASDVLCTVRLSRKLYPSVDGHGLDALIARHDLRGFARHRAMGDTEATAAFVQYASDEHGVDAMKAAVKSLLKMPSLPAHLGTNAISDIPDSAGVYLFYGINDLPIYIGKAKHLRERIRSHFSSDHMTPNDIRLSQELRRIEWIPTAGEFSALLLEAQLVKEKLPLHNVALRKRDKIGFLSLRDEQSTPTWMPAAELAESTPLANSGALRSLYFGPFGDKTNAKKWLVQAAKEHQLCDHVLGFSKPRNSSDPCFSRQVGRCYGVCVGAETLAQHRQRLLAALTQHELPEWPFDGIATFEERDIVNDRVDILQFDEWCAVYGGARLPFDADVFKLLRRMLARNLSGFSGSHKINAR